MKRCHALRVVAVLYKNAIDRADRGIGAGYMFALMFGIAHATAEALRFGRAWWATFLGALDKNIALVLTEADA